MTFEEAILADQQRRLRKGIHALIAGLDGMRALGRVCDPEPTCDHCGAKPLTPPEGYGNKMAILEDGTLLCMACYRGRSLPPLPPADPAKSITG